MEVAIIGLGLIGGSLGLAIRRDLPTWRRIGVEANPRHASQALDLDIVQELRPLEEACQRANVVILAMPVSVIREQLPIILDKVGDHTTVTDVGSVKASLVAAVAHHPRRRQYVAAHPMAGTENSGPTAAIDHLFHGKVLVICNREESGPENVTAVEDLFRPLSMRIRYMDAEDHDVHAAYVSHLSHVISYVLAATVLEKEASDENIFDLAAGGFASTARLAKSSPKMWRQIFEENLPNLLDVLGSYQHKLEEIRRIMADKDFAKMEAFLAEAHDIRRVLN